MAIYDLFLNNPRTRAARYAASQAESGALRQTSGVLGNQAVNPAAAAQSLAQTSATQRAANHGMVAQAQAADEAARAEGVQQLVGTGLSALSSGMAMGMGGMGGKAGGGGPLKTVTDLVGGLVPPTTQGAAPAPSVAQGAMGPAPATFQGFGNAGAPFMGQPQMAPGVAAGAPGGSFSGANPYAAPAGPSPEAQQYLQGAGVDQALGNIIVPKPPMAAQQPTAAGVLDGAGLTGSAPALGNVVVPQPQTQAARSPAAAQLQRPTPSESANLPAPPAATPMPQQPAPAQSAAPGGDQTAVNMMQAFAPILLDYFARYGAR